MPTPPPPQFVSRRATRQAQLRRRRLSALGLALGLAAALIVVLITSGSGSGSRAAAGGSGRASAGAPLSAATHHVSGTRSVGSDSVGGAEASRLARLGHPLYCGGSRGNALAFTFDDGPGPYTHFAIKKLSQAHERATFFTVGRSIDNFPGWLAREMPLAAIGDHTYTHPLLTQLPATEISSQIQRTAARITSQTGRAVSLFRPPYGAHNAVVDGIAQRLGMLEILWNVDSADSLGANYAGIIRNVEAGMHPGSIILMHENRGQTIRALTTLLPELHRRGLRSVSIPELLASDPPSAPQLRARTGGCSAAVLHGSGG